MHPFARAAALLLAVTSTSLLGGCAADDQAALAAAQDFVQADAAQACAMLAPQTAAKIGNDCAGALGRLGLHDSGTVVGVTVAGQSALVSFQRYAVFLSSFPDGWRVVAADCRPAEADEPYDCQVQP